MPLSTPLIIRAIGVPLSIKVYKNSKKRYGYNFISGSLLKALDKKLKDI